MPRLPSTVVVLSFSLGLQVHAQEPIIGRTTCLPIMEAGKDGDGVTETGDVVDEPTDLDPSARTWPGTVGTQVYLTTNKLYTTRLCFRLY